MGRLPSALAKPIAFVNVERSPPALAKSIALTHPHKSPIKYMQPTITIPKGWEYPRFTLGERTQQGMIVGLEYYPADSQLAHEYGHGWRYSVMPNKNSQEVRHYFDDQIQTLSIAEIQQQIQAEIEDHQQQIKTLQQQLVVIKGGNTNG